MYVASLIDFGARLEREAPVQSSGAPATTAHEVRILSSNTDVVDSLSCVYTQAYIYDIYAV